MQIPVAPDARRRAARLRRPRLRPVETLVEGPAEAAYRRLPPPERRGVVRAWVDALADAFQTGSLADALERAETYGRGHGLAGSSAEVTLGGSLALERAIDRALAGPPALLRRPQRREVVAAMSQLTVRVATAWAAAVAGRGPRPGAPARPSGVRRRRRRRADGQHHALDRRAARRDGPHDDPRAGDRDEQEVVRGDAAAAGPRRGGCRGRAGAPPPPVVT